MAVADLILPWDITSVSRTREPDASVIEALEALAFADAEVSSRAESLFMFLRKISSQGNAKEYLMGVQYLAVMGDPAGARLLAAFLDVSTPGDRLLPRVQHFNSSRRLRIRIRNDNEDPGNIHQDWLERLEGLAERCGVLAGTKDSPGENEMCRPGEEPPWSMMRDSLELLFARLTLGDDFDDGDRKLLVELLRLEVDAWQERISLLAGSIDPFRVAAISRVLPLLGQADAEIRDLRQMIGWIEQGCQGNEFETPVSRSLDVLEDNDRSALRRILTVDPDLAPLSELFEGLSDHPVSVPIIAFCLQRLQALATRLTLLGVPGVEIDLITGARLIQKHFPEAGDSDEFQLPLTPGFPEACRHILETAEDGMGKAAADMSGLDLRNDHLVINIPEGGLFLEHDLPATVGETSSDDQVDEIQTWADDLQDDEIVEEEPDKVDLNSATVTELKHLVLSNIQSISVLLGFLRNPKVVAIPGLVEDVVNRTRNPKVIETIARVRILHTGFANRTVPLACLRSPVNIPIAVLRKFIHVKYVSKMDLKRMAMDKGGIRKEVGLEIKKYMKALT